MALSQPTALGVAYARALFELALAQNQAQPIGDELAAIGQVLKSDRAFVEFLYDPAIGRAQRSAELEKIFAPSASPMVMNFLRVVGRHNRMKHLIEITDAYTALLDAHMGKVEIELTVAQSLSDQELERVRQQIGAAINKTAVVHQTVDNGIIGGMILRVGDRLVDASVRYQLQAMRDKFIAAAPK